MLLLSTEASFKPMAFFWEFTSRHLPQRLIFCRSSLAHKGCGYSISCTELSVGIIGIYGIGSQTSYLKPYTLIERIEREMLDERYIVYLYIIDLCTELDGLDSLASDDGTYIMTVNIDDTVTDFSPFKHFLFLYKNLPDDGKMFMIILGISEWGSVLSMNFTPLIEEFFKESDHAWAFLPLKLSSFFSCSRTDRIPPHSCICCADALCQSLQYMPVEPFEAFPKKFHVRKKMHMVLIACGIGHADVKVIKIRFPVWS